MVPGEVKREQGLPFSSLRNHITRVAKTVLSKSHDVLSEESWVYLCVKCLRTSCMNGGSSLLLATGQVVRSLSLEVISKTF